jgi:hypothetical protein
MTSSFPAKYPGPRPAECIRCGKKVRDDRERYCNNCGEDFWDPTSFRYGGQVAEAAHSGRSVLFSVRGVAVASSQLPVREGSHCALEFDTEAVVVIGEPPQNADSIATVPFRQVTSLNIGGRGEVTEKTGGGWIGGGFGTAGIVEGAALASLLNALTTRTKTTVETLVELSAGSQALIVMTAQEPPSSLRVHMAPVFDRLASAQRTTGAFDAGSSDRIAMLRELGSLRDSGVLTEEEFTAEKSRILRS